MLHLEYPECSSCMMEESLKQWTVLHLAAVGTPAIEDVVVIPHHHCGSPRHGLRRINKLMDEVKHITSHIAHELRTPLTRLQSRLLTASEMLEGPAREELLCAVQDSERIQDWAGAVASDQAVSAAWQRYGYDLVDQLRRDEKLCDLPVIMVTARTADEDISKGFSSGTDIYIEKPFKPSELVAFVRRFIGPAKPDAQL